MHIQRLCLFRNSLLAILYVRNSILQAKSDHRAVDEIIFGDHSCENDL